MIKLLHIRDVRVKGSPCLEVTICVKPRARRTSLYIEGNELIFLTNEPPLEGRANQSLIKYLSKLLKLSRKNIELVKGVKSRVKVLRICGINPKDFMNIVSQAKT